jgi:hypothetical protein
MKWLNTTGLALVMVSLPGIASAEESPVTFGGVGWVQYGQIGHATDTLPNNYNGNPMQSSGAQISVQAVINANLQGAVGMGVYEGHPLGGQISDGGRALVSASPYIAEARFTYLMGEKASPLLQVTGGLFHYNYDPNIKDLGLYLLRGSVYPGFLVSGFETKDVVPLSNILGLWFRNVSGILTSDLLVNCETELKPFFDLSLAYVGRAKVGGFLTLGAGVNFYRLIPNDSKSSHKPFNPVTETSDADAKNIYSRNFIYVDTVGARVDTTFLGFDGTKLMADFELDPKALMGIGSMGSEDLKLYGEAAVMGLSFDKAHKAIYGDVANRIPVMVGFNFPMFSYLDHLAMEVEWYGAKFRDDIYRLQPDFERSQREVSPIPFDYSQDVPGPKPKTYSRDNVKWAIHAAKTIQGHFKVSGQVSNDHFRPYGTASRTSYEVATSTPKDWYWVTKIAYWF